MASKRLTLLVSSAVYGFEELLDRLYAILDGLGYEVWMSHKGTVPVNSSLTALDNCRRAVAECDLFLGIILPRYGSGKEKPDEESITHEELRHAIHLKKPRWILAHVLYLRGFMERVGRGTLKMIQTCREEGLPLPQWRVDMETQIKHNSVRSIRATKFNRPSAKRAYLDIIRTCYRCPTRHLAQPEKRDHDVKAT